MARDLDERKKLLIAVAVGVVVVGVLLYLTYDARKKIQQAQNDIIIFQGNIRKARERIKEIPTLREKRYALTNAVEEYVKILPDGREVNELLDTLSDLKKEAEVEVINLRIISSPKRKTMSKNFEKHERETRLRGTFFNIAKFVNLLERYKRFMSVENFTMKPEEGNVQEVQLRFSTFTYQRTGSPAAKPAR